MVDRGERIREEYELLRSVFEAAVYNPVGDWFLIPDDHRAAEHGWLPTPFPVAFHAQTDHPGQAPYGIYVPSGVTVRGSTPNNFQASAQNRPAFPGTWGVLSWSVEGPWIPKGDVRAGANLLSFALSFIERYRTGP